MNEFLSVESSIKSQSVDKALDDLLTTLGKIEQASNIHEVIEIYTSEREQQAIYHAVGVNKSNVAIEGFATFTARGGIVGIIAEKFSNLFKAMNVSWSDPEKIKRDFRTAANNIKGLSDEEIAEKMESFFSAQTGIKILIKEFNKTNYFATRLKDLHRLLPLMDKLIVKAKSDTAPDKVFKEFILSVNKIIEADVVHARFPFGMGAGLIMYETKERSFKWTNNVTDYISSGTINNKQTKAIVEKGLNEYDVKASIKALEDGIKLANAFEEKSTEFTKVALANVSWKKRYVLFKAEKYNLNILLVIIIHAAKAVFTEQQQAYEIAKKFL